MGQKSCESNLTRFRGPQLNNCPCYIHPQVCHASILLSTISKETVSIKGKEDEFYDDVTLQGTLYSVYVRGAEKVHDLSCPLGPS
jgi:hypothetical protein